MYIETMTNKQVHRKIWNHVFWDLWWRCYSALEAQNIYYLQLNREVGLLHTTKIAVANLRRSSLCTGAAFRPKFRWVEKTMVGIFCTHCQHSQLEQKKSLPSLWASLAEDFVILIVLRLWGPWHSHVHNTHSLRISLAQGFRCFPQWDKINLTNK